MRKLLLLFILLIGSLAYSQNTARMLSGVNYQNGTSYLFAPSDTTKVVAFSNVAPVAAALPTPTVIGLGTGIVFSVNNLGIGTVTITCTLCTINGFSTLVLATGAGADIYSDGTNYTAITGASSIITPPGTGLCLVSTGSTPGAFSWQSCTGSAATWGSLLPGSGTIGTGTFNVGTGSTMTTTGSGVINATTLGGATFASPGAIGGTTASTIKGTTINATTGFQINGTAPNSHCLIGNGTNYVDSSSCGGGTVTSVGLTQTGSFFTITGSPVTTAGSINIAPGILPVANGGTGTATPALIAGTNISITGSWPNQTINATGGGSSAWSALTNPTGNLSLSMGTNTSSFSSGDFGASPVTGVFNWTDSSTSSTDSSFDLSVSTPTTSYHNPFIATVGANQVFAVCSTGGGSAPTGFVVVGINTPNMTCPLLTQTPFSRFWNIVATSTHVGATFYDSAVGYSTNLVQLFAHTVAGTGFNFLATCANASNAAGGTCTSYLDTIRGDGLFTAPSIVISGLTPGTSPVCPNGTGGALTTAGCSGGGGGTANYDQAFTSQTTITMLGTSHGFGTKDLLLDCYDTASPANHIQPASFTIDPSSFNVVVNFAVSQSGYCALNGSGGGGGGGSGTVTSIATTGPITGGTITTTGTIACPTCLTTSSTRTWSFSYQGVCQSGVSSAPINFPLTNSPSYVACTSTNITPEWQIPGSNTADTFWVKLRVPPSHTGAYTLTTTYRSAATTGTATVQPTYACVAAGAVPDNPSFSNAGSTFTLTPAGTTLQNVTTTDTFTPTCADGADLYVMYTLTANSVASPINFSYVSLAVQGAM